MAKATAAKRQGEKLVYLGEEFPGFNKPKKAPAGSKHKMVVLAKKGDEIKKVSFGHRDYEDYRQHGSEKRRENYLARSAGIRNKSGELTKDDKFSANYWARKKLW
jgi:hypothetical protein